MGKLFNKKIIVVSAIIIIVVLVSIFAFGGNDEAAYDTVVAEQEDLIQEINATGRVEADKYVDLAFEKSGRVKHVYVDVGDTVVRGQALVELESDELLAELAQSRAAVESAIATLQKYEAALGNQEAKLAELKVGTREEEIILYQSKVHDADIALTAARDNIVDVMQDAYTRSEDAVRVKADQLFNSPTTQNPVLKFTTTDSSLRTDIYLSRVSLEELLVSWKSDLDTLTDNSDLDLIVVSSKNNLDQVQLFLEKVSTALNGANTSSAVSQATIDSWKTDISSARTSVNTAITNRSAAKEKFDTAETALLIAQNELVLKEAGSTPERIDAQEAAIQQAQANINTQRAEIKLKESAVQAAQAKLAKNVLISPISGIVTVQDAKEGAIVGANEDLVSVITEGEFKIEALIVEADIENLEVGDKATFTLDAYGDDLLFKAIVIDIDPAAELIEGVANYRATLEFDDAYERIRVGMTADLDIVTAERESVIVIPQRAVIFKDDKKIVRILDNGTLREVEVETGIASGRGQIEIISGIEEGDVVVTSVKK